MRLLIIIGAGASLDCWPNKKEIVDFERLPLANNLFASLVTQDKFLDSYELTGIASKLRRQFRVEGKNFDVERELEIIATKATKSKDFNNEQALFKTRFYFHSLITELTRITLNKTSSHTSYVDLITQLKDWIEEEPETRKVDIITFNYDDLIENAMSNVYSYDWHMKSSKPLSAYYKGTNLRIYKPHGSINWGRVVEGKLERFKYVEYIEAFQRFNKIKLLDDFRFVDPDDFPKTMKNYIPAIAVPMKNKVDFKECPKEMYETMVEAMGEADVAVTIGWKGGDNHFVELLKERNKDLKKIHIMGPNADTNLTESYPDDKFEYHKFGFSQFVSRSVRFEELLDRIIDPSKSISP